MIFTVPLSITESAVGRRLDLEYDEEVRAMLPQIVGGLTVALAWTFRTLDPDVKNPDTTHWDRAIEIFNRLL